MSRHRNVRSMNYSDEYDGLDDIYGHSVEDDYSISPSDEAQFLYDRTRQPQMSAFFKEGEDIAEEDEARLRACLEQIRGVVGDCVSEHVLVQAVLGCSFDVHRALDQVLQCSHAADAPKPQRQPHKRKKEKDDYDEDEGSPDCLCDTRHRISTTKFPMQSFEALPIRISKIRNSVSPSPKTLPNQFIESSLDINNLGHIKQILSRLNSIAIRSSDKLSRNSKCYRDNTVADESRMNCDNFEATVKSRAHTGLSIPKFEIKIGSESNKENDQDLLSSSQNMKTNSEKWSPSSSEDEDGGGLSSLSALAKQHERACPRTCHEPKGIGVGTVRDTAAEEKCFSSLADLITSHLNPSGGPRPWSDRGLLPGSSQDGDDVVVDLTAALKASATKLAQDERVEGEVAQMFLEFGEEQPESVEPQVCRTRAGSLSLQTLTCGQQEPSSFGKILCKKWKLLPVPKILHRKMSEHTIKHFAFDCLSPDDVNLKNRRRK